MAKVINVYRDGEIVKSAEVTGAEAKVTVDGLDADTNYPEGTFKVSYEENGKESEQEVVPAFKTDAIKVSSITLNQKTATIEHDGTFQIEATVDPSNATNNGVTYESANTDVVTVNNSGKVEAVGEGKANVTASAKDGSGVEAVIAITVKPEPEPEPDEEVPEE